MALTKADVVIASNKALSEAKRSFEQADLIRQTAGVEGKLLKPDDILSGVADAGKLFRYLTAMPNGQLRPITLEDIKHFDRLRGKLRAQWKDGIRAKDIVDMASVRVPGQNQSDLRKAQEQIHTAVPYATVGGEVRFSVNSGPNSDRPRHYVTIKLLNFGAVVASPVEAEKLVKTVTGGPLQIGCDCGQFRFVFAYIATSGGFGLPSHRETAFPKLKNPTLSGVACKHIVKVASMLQQSPTIKTYIAKLIERERDKTQTKMARVRKEDQAKVQADLRQESYRQKRIATTETKRAERKRWAESRALRNAATMAPKQKKTTSASRRAIDKAAALLAKEFGLTADEVLALLAARQKG